LGCCFVIEAGAEAGVEAGAEAGVETIGVGFESGIGAEGGARDGVVLAIGVGRRAIIEAAVKGRAVSGVLAIGSVSSFRRGGSASEQGVAGVLAIGAVVAGSVVWMAKVASTGSDETSLGMNGALSSFLVLSSSRRLIASCCCHWTAASSASSSSIVSFSGEG